MAQAMFIKCPNCNDDRYQSRGGFSNPGLCAAVMPSCLICSNIKELAVCYSCNMIQRFTTIHISGDTSHTRCCQNCNNPLNPCSSHEWHVTPKGAYACKKCNKEGTPQTLLECPPNKHIWTCKRGAETDLECSSCKKLATLV